MPAIEENHSELLMDGYHHLRHPEEHEVPVEDSALEARLRFLRERKSPPLPSLKEVWQGMKEAWTEAGKAWDAERAEKAAAKEARSTKSPQL